MPSRLIEESYEVDFLRNAQLTVDWARQHLYRIGMSAHFGELRTQLASALQIHEELLDRSEESLHQRLRCSPRRRSVQKESNEKDSPWIRLRYCLLESMTNWTLTCSLQGATKSCHCCSMKRRTFGKMNIPNGSKHVLYDLVQGLDYLLNIESTDNVAIAFTYFDDDSDKTSDTEFESLDSETVKEVGAIMKVRHAFVLNEDPDWISRSGHISPVRLES